jgi:D-beta-D-heptose 7-phosphate kinase/D-beta-D-heptose 1-phosphate adenosyltransferase
MTQKSLKKFYFSTPLARVLSRARAQGKRIVFTNGVYDLLHAGHVTLLAQAKKQGDILVVGLNSDASVRRLKGPSRPMANEKDRALVIGALESVDYVTVFSEDTPYELIKKLKPDVLVKGGDYAVQEMVGRDLVKKVVRVPLVQGRSTSALIQKVLKAYGK